MESPTPLVEATKRMIMNVHEQEQQKQEQRTLEKAKFAQLVAAHYNPVAPNSELPAEKIIRPKNNPYLQVTIGIGATVCGIWFIKKILYDK